MKAKIFADNNNLVSFILLCIYVYGLYFVTNFFYWSLPFPIEGRIRYLPLTIYSLIATVVISQFIFYENSKKVVFVIIAVIASVLPAKTFITLGKKSIESSLLDVKKRIERYETKKGSIVINLEELKKVHLIKKTDFPMFLLFRQFYYSSGPFELTIESYISCLSVSINRRNEFSYMDF